MIKIIEKFKIRTEPHFLLKFEYCHSHSLVTHKTEYKISPSNPYLEKLCLIINKIKPINSSYIIFDISTLIDNLKYGYINNNEFSFIIKIFNQNLTKKDIDHIYKLVNLNSEDDFKFNEIDNIFIQEFEFILEGFIPDSNNQFYGFKKYKLNYVNDEYEIFNTIFE